MTANVYSPVLPLTAGVTNVFTFGLLSRADTKIFKSSPTLAAGDFILSVQTGGIWARIGNLATVPSLLGIDTETLLMTITAAEIPAGTQAVSIKCKDASGAEWCDLIIEKPVMAAAAVGTSDFAGGAVASVTAGVTVSTNNDKTGYELSATGIDAIIDEVIEGTTTFRQMLRLMASVLFGKSTGGGTTNPKFRDLADTKNRVDATVDTSGNRSAVSRDAT